jgi:hypothetical protein
VFFTFGHIGQTYADCLPDLAYLRKNRGRINFFATTMGLRVYPGTALERKARARGLLPPDFSWARYTAPRKNLLLLEPGDVFILTQKGLSTRHFLVLIFRLVIQKTVLSPEHIPRLLVNNARNVLHSLFLVFYHTKNRVTRGFIALRGAWAGEVH